MKTLLNHVATFIVTRLVLIVASIVPLDGKTRKQLTLVAYLTVLGYAAIGILLFVVPRAVSNYETRCELLTKANQYPELDVTKIPIYHLSRFLKHYANMRPQWDGEYVTAATTKKWVELQGFTCDESRIGEFKDRVRFRCNNRVDFETLRRTYGRMSVLWYLKHEV
jgi:hypothetical protein